MPAAQVLHLDIKPANILLDDSGTCPKIAGAPTCRPPPVYAPAMYQYMRQSPAVDSCCGFRFGWTLLLS